MTARTDLEHRTGQESPGPSRIANRWRVMGMRETAGKGAPAGGCRPSGVSPQSRSLSVPPITDELLARAARRSSSADRRTLRKRAEIRLLFGLGKGLQTRSRPIIA